MEKEGRMSGVLKALRNVASLLSSFLPLLGPSSPRTSPAPGGEQWPSGSRKSSSRVSSRQFWEPWPRGTLQGILSAIPRMAKELVQWPEAPQRQGAKVWSCAMGLGRLPETQGPGDLCPAQNCITVSCLASWGRERKSLLHRRYQ